MADEEYSDEERALVEKHRAARKRTGRKVKVRGRDEQSGAEYEFDLEGDEAERVVSRHRHLFAEEEAEAGSASEDSGKAGKTPYFRAKKASQG